MRNKSQISETVKQKRKELGLTQEDLALRSGVGLRFIRDLEQGKETVRLDKVNDVLRYFGLEVGVIKLRQLDE
ncbi:MAG: helix-turn-helix transcriptional regulator [Candidatus Caldatribacteriota bacterium]